MRRVQFAMPALSGVRLECSPAVGWERLRAWLLVLVGAAILAAGVTVVVTNTSVARRPGSRFAAGDGLPVAAWGPVSSALGAADRAYGVTQGSPEFVARNPRQRLTAHFSAAGMSIRSGTLLLNIRLRADGYGNALRPAPTLRATARANRVVYRAGSLTMWYSNGPLGLEQGFTLKARPSGHRGGPLTLALALSGDARAATSAGRSAVTFSHGNSSLSYRGLVVTDARGRMLPAWLQLRGRELLLRVDDAGAQYPLRVDPFIQQAKLTASDGAAYDNLGDSVGIAGDTIVAGAPYATVNGNAGQGAVYVFVEPRSGWANATETAKLTASDGAANDNLGVSVGISGDTVVAGSNATVNGNADQGAVYVFDKPWAGWRTETQAAKLTASDGAAGDYLDTVAIAGDTVVAGSAATINGNANQGAAYVFAEPRGGWRSETQAAKLTASDGAAGDYLGWEVAIDGDTIVATAPFAAVDGNPDEGAVYVFIEPRGGWRSETQAAKLTASDGAANENLGYSVAINADTIVAGAPFTTVDGDSDAGAAYVFSRPQWGWRSETDTAELTASDINPDIKYGLGSAVSILGNTIVAGAPFETLPNGPEGIVFEGAIYVYGMPPGGWRNETQTDTLTGSDITTVGWLGYSLATQGDTIVAGAPLTTVGANLVQGAVYVFTGHEGNPEHVTENASADQDGRGRASTQREPEWCAHQAALHGKLASRMPRRDLLVTPCVP
jgi:trimeric autotransporter adhesin